MLVKRSHPPGARAVSEPEAERMIAHEPRLQGPVPMPNTGDFSVVTGRAGLALYRFQPTHHLSNAPQSFTLAFV